MKIAALILMLISVFALFGYGFMFLLGFAMSFDAPGSGEDPKAWGMRLLMFLPLLLLIVGLIISIMAFSSGNYRRAILINIVPIRGCCAILFGYMVFTSFTTTAKYKAIMAQEAKDAELYPEQRFLRNVEGGTDTIIVFSNRIVAYRKYMGTGNPWGGPLGDLNEERNTIKYLSRPDTKIAKEELDQFIDATGRKFTDVYTVE